MAPVMQTDLQDYIPLVASGKVREVYELDGSTLLFVATDRVSGKALNAPLNSAYLNVFQPTTW